MTINNKEVSESAKPKFAELLAHPAVRARWEKVRKYCLQRNDRSEEKKDKQKY